MQGVGLGMRHSDACSLHPRNAEVIAERTQRRFNNGITVRVTVAQAKEEETVLAAPSPSLHELVSGVDAAVPAHDDYGHAVLHCHGPDKALDREFLGHDFKMLLLALKQIA